MPRFRRPLPSLLLAAAALFLLCGYVVVGNKIETVYYGTLDANGLTYDTSDGAPTTTEFSRVLPASLPALPSNLAARIAVALPEGKDIRTNAVVQLPESDDQTNLRFSADADVWVTFVSEGAAYHNSVGWFRYNTATPPARRSDVTEQMFLPNASQSGANAMGGSGPLDVVSATKQNTTSLGRFHSGEGLGFMLVANGYTADGRDFNGTRIPGVNDSASPTNIVYTLRSLNPEAQSTAKLNVHTVVLNDQTLNSSNYQRLVLGFEDINREAGGDHDFNDVVMVIHVVPASAPNASTSPIANLASLQALPPTGTLGDADHDGVPDISDDYPNDATKAYNAYYPTATTWGTLAYEDMWPKRGDYDLNDVVLHYRTNEVLNAARQVVGVRIDFEFLARGGTFETAFGLRLPSVPRTSVSATRLQLGGVSVANAGPEVGQTDAVFIVAPKLSTLLPSGSAGCVQVNTVATCAKVPAVAAHLEVDFASPLAASLFQSPYDPFIYTQNNRGQEVHLPGRQPTALANAALFKTVDDRTTVGTSTTYMDANRRPWALDIPTDWRWPLELTDIVKAYPTFASWATSGGTTAKDWYLPANAVKANLYSR
ncbi:MAG: hypothetical protein RIQ60_4152 [Pseudomonadota bacterium]|jgi:LruC domain-containing protein